jgi:hypothetical protein
MSEKKSEDGKARCKACREKLSKEENKNVWDEAERIGTHRVIENEKKLIDYETNNLYEMVESAPKDMEHNVKYPKEYTGGLFFMHNKKQRRRNENAE